MNRNFTKFFLIIILIIILQGSIAFSFERTTVEKGLLDSLKSIKIDGFSINRLEKSLVSKEWKISEINMSMTNLSKKMLEARNLDTDIKKIPRTVIQIRITILENTKDANKYLSDNYPTIDNNSFVKRKEMIGGGSGSIWIMKDSKSKGKNPKDLNVAVFVKGNIAGHVLICGSNEKIKSNLITDVTRKVIEKIP